MNKVCHKCHEEKELLTNFFPDVRYTGGYNHTCKTCRNEANIALAKEKTRTRERGNCLQCGKSLTGLLNRRKFCSDPCGYIYNMKAMWGKQKVRPGYAAYHAKKARDWQKKQQARGNCVTCGKKLDTNLTKCSKCSELSKQQMRAYNKKKRSTIFSS